MGDDDASRTNAQGCVIMIELQILRIQQTIPALFGVIENAIQGVYRHIEEETRTARNDPLFQKRLGYCIHTWMEHSIRVAIEEANIPNVSVEAVSNGSGTPHLEIYTPYAILVFAHVQRIGNVPRNAKYRQKYIDQMFMQEVFPEYAEYTSESKPLYVVTYTLVDQKTFSASTRIGRLTVDQEGWSWIYSLNDLASQRSGIEQINPGNTITPLETVVRKNRIQLKK